MQCFLSFRASTPKRHASLRAAWLAWLSVLAGAVPHAHAQVGRASPDTVWSPLSVMALVNPLSYGAVGDGVADDLPALQSAIAALPAGGGIVYLPAARSFKKSNLLTITRDHVKLWSENRGAEVFQSIAGQRRHQSILCRGNDGCGLFGLKLRSDASDRFDALEDNQFSADHGSMVEVVGCEVQGSAATGLFFYGSSDSYVAGNYIHHTYADHIHHTDGASRAWVWGNYIFNEAPSNGDDGVACVTYGPASRRCHQMEWWDNTILQTGWGRGLSVIGGEYVSIHDNWVVGVAGAGIIVASEVSYDTASSQTIVINDNYVANCGHKIAHPNILISGASPAAGPLSTIHLVNNVSIGGGLGPYRLEGATRAIWNIGLSSDASALPRALPTLTDVKLADTTELRTLDTSHVPVAQRAGLLRIHVRRNQVTDRFEQRFEYVVKGPSERVRAFLSERSGSGDFLVERRTRSGVDYALLLCAVPIALPGDLLPVTFSELRTGDREGTLSGLWTRVDRGLY